MLLFFDIDGTLLDNRHELPATVKPAMELACRNGHQLIINTGRTLCNRETRLADFPLSGWIMGCGTRIIYQEETLAAMAYSPAESMLLRDCFLRAGIPAVYECDTGMYFDPEGPAHPAIDLFRGFSDMKGIGREIRAEDPEFRAVKMFCFSKSESAIRDLEAATAEIGMPYRRIKQDREGWEMVPLGYSKGTGITFLRERLGFTEAECFAFGDSRNDLEMLQAVTHSVAMDNAEEEIKAICEYVTARPEEDGIAKAMRHYGLI